MASTINATTSGVVTTGDTVATLALQTSGINAVSVDTSQNVTLSKSLIISGSTSGNVTFTANAISGTQSYTLPTAVPAVNGYALTATTGGVMSWAAASATPGGSTTQVQYNNAGSFAGSANMTFDGTTLTAAGFSGPLNGTVGATTANTGTFSSTVHKGATSGTITLTAPAVAGTQSYTLPTAVPASNGYVLSSTTAGVMSWAAAGSGSPGGSTTQLQYNNAGAFGGISGVTTDGTRITASTTIGVGGATPSTSGSGITFPATSSISSSVKTLDDYERGTWTPSLGGTATYSTQSGKYVKIGRFVWVDCILEVLLIGTGSTTSVTGLPFAISGSNVGGTIGYFAGLASSVYSLHIRASGTGFVVSGFTAATNNVPSAAIYQNSTRTDISFGYYTAA